MSNHKGCPHCGRDLSEYGLSVADHHDGDQWLCPPIPGPSVEASLAREYHALHAAGFKRELAAQMGVPAEGPKEHLRNALQILAGLIAESYGVDGEPFLVNYQDDLLGLERRITKALEALDA